MSFIFTTKKNEIYTREKKKITLFIFSACIMFSLALGILTYKQLSELVIQQTKENCIAFVNNVAKEIDGDAFSSISSEDDEQYNEIMRTLKDSYFYKHIKAVYTIKFDGETPVYAVDASIQNPSPFKKKYDKDLDIGRIITQEAVNTGIFRSDYGSYYTVYAPIKDSNHLIVGIVCMDINAKHIDSYRFLLRNSLIFIIGIFTIVLFIIYVIISTEIAEKDILTGLPNYEKLIYKGALLEEKNAMGRYTAIIINIKNFKVINQKHGYEEGNRILAKLAATLSDKLKKNHFIARIGSDNFIILMPNNDADEYIKFLKEKNPASHSDVTTETLPAPVRCGIYKASNTDSIERVISICFISMNKTRENGHEDFSYYDDSVYEGVIEDGNILVSFQRAIRNKEFKVFYQPKVDIRTGKLCGAEALVRWHAGNEFIQPIHFVPVFEAEGLIMDLDMYVLHTICEDINRWKKKGITPVRIAVNFSKLHLDDPLFSQKIIKELDDMDIDYKNISIEMTESSGYSNMKALNKFVKEMAEKDITVAMDDFGTGYSSLSLLGDIKMQDIKIDKSFIDKVFDDAAGSEENSKLVENVIHMIKDLNRTVVCEGVEVKAQLDFIKEAGCDIVQGYYFDKPLSVNDFEIRLKHPDYTIADG